MTDYIEFKFGPYQEKDLIDRIRDYVEAIPIRSPGGFHVIVHGGVEGWDIRLEGINEGIKHYCEGMEAGINLLHEVLDKRDEDPTVIGLVHDMMQWMKSERNIRIHDLGDGDFQCHCCGHIYNEKIDKCTQFDCIMVRYERLMKEK